MDRTAQLSDISVLDPAILDLARSEAFDRYIQALLIGPQAVRPTLIVVAAFHGEMARIPLLVREPMMGEIRLQWWHDQISSCAEVASGAQAKPQSPLAAEVCKITNALPATREYFLSAIAARRAELDPDAIAGPSAFAKYLEDIGAPGFLIVAEALGLERTQNNLAAIRHAGKAVAAIEFLLRLQRFADLGRSFVIPDAQNGLTAADAHDQTSDDMPSQRLKRWADAALNVFQTVYSERSPQLAQSVLPIALVQPYLRVLQKRSEAAFEDGNPLTPLGRVVRLWWAARTGRLCG